jgi:PAS domain S-box-containing protein
MTLPDEHPAQPPLSKRSDRILREYVANSELPTASEVKRLVDDMVLRNSELENTVANLKGMLKQLEAYRDRYVDLYELAPVGYATLDDEGYVQEMNLAGSQLFGMDRDELIGYLFSQYVHPNDQAAFRTHIDGCCHEKEPITFEVGILAKDGRCIPVQVRGVPVESLKTDGTFCKLAITDISERKAVEETIRASEANYRAIFDTANDAIFVHDVDTGAFLDANQKATEMYGYPLEEFRGADVGLVSEGSPPYSEKEAKEWIQKALGGEPQRFDWRCKDKSGRTFWGSVNLKRAVLNGVPKLLAIVRDITERKNAEETLRQSEERFRTVANYTYDWEYWRGRDGKFQYVSPSCERITGYAAAEFMADPALLERIVHPEDRGKVTQHLQRESPDPRPHTAEYRIISKAGKERWIEHICQPVYGIDDAWLGQRASNRDITDRKLMERELKRRIVELQMR